MDTICRFPLVAISKSVGTRVKEGLGSHECIGKVFSHPVKYSPAIINTTSGVQFMQSTSTPQQCLIRTYMRSSG